jgi:hypothetical protein
VFFVPFGLLVGGVFVVNALENCGHDWVALEAEPVFAYVPAGAHLVGAGHTGLAFTERCAPHVRCEYVWQFASPLPVDALRAQVEQDLARMGFVRVRPRPARCPPASAHAERFARGEVSVWPSYGPTPYAIGRSHTVGVADGAAVVRLAIDNMQIYWGC